MRKILLLLLCFPIILSCGDDDPKITHNKETLKECGYEVDNSFINYSFEIGKDKYVTKQVQICAIKFNVPINATEPLPITLDELQELIDFSELKIFELDRLGFNSDFAINQYELNPLVMEIKEDGTVGSWYTSLGKIPIKRCSIFKYKGFYKVYPLWF